MPIRVVPDGDLAWGPEFRALVDAANAPVHAVGSVTGSTTLNVTAGANKTLTLTGNVSFTFTGSSSGYHTVLHLIITQDGVGGRTITWPGSVRWPNAGSAPTVSTAAGAINRYVFISTDGGVVWHGLLLTHVPPDGTVTNATVASGAAINADKTANGTTNKVFTATEQTKLSGVATGATANSTDANLLNRANHTGTQSADTITDGSTNKVFTAADETKLNGIGAVRTVNPSGGTISIDANTAGNNIDSTLTADATLNVPTNGASGQVLYGSVLASGAQRILTFHASLARLNGVDATLTIPTGKVGRYAARRSDVTGSAKWIVEAAGVEQ